MSRPGRLIPEDRATNKPFAQLEGGRLAAIANARGRDRPSIQRCVASALTIRASNDRSDRWWPEVAVERDGPRLGGGGDRGGNRLDLGVEAGRSRERPDRGRLTGLTEVSGVLDELRDIARGIHPAALAEGGLRPALKALAGRAGVPVELDVRAEEWLPEQIEVAAFYTVSEALTNAAKHSRATIVHVRAEVFDGSLRVTVSDNGIGGADPGTGSGLLGLSDRADALGGTIVVTSPPGEGTTLALRLPIDRAIRSDDAVA
jgi:signal transduction histidine kinase